MRISCPHCNEDIEIQITAKPIRYISNPCDTCGNEIYGNEVVCAHDNHHAKCCPYPKIKC